MKKVSVSLFYLFLFFFLSIISGYSEEKSYFLDVSFIEKQAKPGDIVHLNIQYLLPEGARLYKNPVIEGIDSLSIMSIKHEPDKFVISLLVDSLDIFEVLPLGLKFLDDKQEEQQFISLKVNLKVISSIDQKTEASEVRDIKGIIDNSGLAWKKVLYIIVPVIIILVLFFLWYKFFRKKGKKENVLHADPFDVVALSAIDRLVKSNLFEKGEIKAFYFSLSKIVREYMENIRSFPAMELTTSEIAFRIEHNENRADRDVLHLLRTIDLIKFADTLPDSLQKEDHCLMAVAYIEKTKPKDV